MRILLVNPNTTEAVTDLMVAAGRAAASPGTIILPETARRGVPYIANEAESLIGGAAALEILVARAADADAAVIAAFGDPGLLAARELLPIPVVGLAEAAMLTACMAGRRFGIATFSSGLVPWYRDCVERHGLAGRCAAIRALDGPFGRLTTVAADESERLVGLATRMAEEDGADALIFAGAPLSGLAARVAHRLPVPVIEQVGAAIRQAETLAALMLRPPRRILPKDSMGLDPALARRLAGIAE